MLHFSLQLLLFCCLWLLLCGFLCYQRSVRLEPDSTTIRCKRKCNVKVLSCLFKFGKKIFMDPKRDFFSSLSFHSEKNITVGC